MTKGKQAKSTELRGLIAERLTAARRAYDPNASQVARDLGITPQVLNAYEKGRNYPDETFLLNFFRLTGCPADWIFQGKMKAEMPPEMAARIGHFAPYLIPGLTEGLAGQPAPAQQRPSAAGGASAKEAGASVPKSRRARVKA